IPNNQNRHVFFALNQIETATPQRGLYATQICHIGLNSCIDSEIYPRVIQERDTLIIGKIRRDETKEITDRIVSYCYSRNCLITHKLRLTASCSEFFHGPPRLNLQTPNRH